MFNLQQLLTTSPGGNHSCNLCVMLIKNCLLEFPKTVQKMKFSIKDFFRVKFTEGILNGKKLFFGPVITQPAWMHLRCTFETSHAASQRHLKES